MKSANAQHLSICFPEPLPTQPVRIHHMPVPLFPSESAVGQPSPRPVAVTAKAGRNCRGRGNPCERASSL